MPDARSPERAPSPAHYDRRTFIARSAALGGLLLGGGGALGALAAPGASATRKRALPTQRKKPNILVIIVDQMRFPRWFGAGGQAGWPPNVQRLASDGVSFGRHYTASNDCTPARSTLLTGLHSHQTGCMITGASTLSPSFDTWGSLLRGFGYNTYYYGKWHLTRGDRHWNEIDGPPELESYGFSGGSYPSPDGAPSAGWHADPQITDQFAQWYATEATQEPWCTTVSFVNPHDIAWWYRWTEIFRPEASAPRSVNQLPPNFETPAELLARNKPRVQRSLQQTTDVSFGDVPYRGRELLPAWLPFLDLYVKLQLTVDAQIGRVLDTLASHPQAAANTVILFTADHGEYGASHGLRGKGAGLYEEGIKVPLIVDDLRGTATRAPRIVRDQLSSSVDIVPLMLTLATGSDDWRRDSGYAHLANRADLAKILADPHAPGREYALHATDEILTEFALEPYSASAPLHVVGLMTAKAKYGVYSRWRPHTLDVELKDQDVELYDYTTADGRLEVDNVAGQSNLEAGLRETLARAVADELHAPLPAALQGAQQDGLADYFTSEARTARMTAKRRARELEQIVGTDLGGALTGEQPKPKRRHHRSQPSGL